MKDFLNANTFDIESPKPGIYKNLPEASYHAAKAFNQSGCNTALEQSFAHYLHNKTSGFSSTPSMILGSLVHCFVLNTPVSDSFIVLPDLSKDEELKEYSRPKTTKIYKEKIKPYLEKAQRENLQLIDNDIVEKAKDIAASVSSKNTIGSLFKCSGETELSIFFPAAFEKNLICKARLDRVLTEDGVVLDLKTTGKSAQYSAFRYNIARYGYDIQAAMYLKAAKWAGYKVDKFVHVVVETFEPYCVAAYVLSDADIHAGDEKLYQAQRMYCKYLKTGIAPGYPDEIQEISMGEHQLIQSERQIATALTNEEIY